jgi:hypothetical protein
VDGRSDPAHADQDGHPDGDGRDEVLRPARDEAGDDGGEEPAGVRREREERLQRDDAREGDGDEHRRRDERERALDAGRDGVEVLEQEEKREPEASVPAPTTATGPQMSAPSVGSTIPAALRWARKPAPMPQAVATIRPALSGRSAPATAAVPPRPAAPSDGPSSSDGTSSPMKTSGTTNSKGMPSGKPVPRRIPTTVPACQPTQRTPPAPR